MGVFSLRATHVPAGRGDSSHRPTDLETICASFATFGVEIERFSNHDGYVLRQFERRVLSKVRYCWLSSS